MPEPISTAVCARARARAVAINLALVGGYALAFAAARVLARSVHGVPGHSAALWLPVLIAARGRLGWPGSAGAVGGAGSALMMPLGGAGHDIAGILVACAAIESPAVALAGWRGPLVLVICGMAANLAKLVVRVTPVLALGLPAKVMLHSPTLVIALHLAFGAIGGVIGWLAVGRARAGATR